MQSPAALCLGRAPARLPLPTPARPGAAVRSAASTRRTNLFGITEPVFEGGGGGILACSHKLLFTHSLVMPRGPRGCSRCGGSARLPAGGSRWCRHGSVQASSRLTAVSHSSLKPLIPGASCFCELFYTLEKTSPFTHRCSESRHSAGAARSWVSRARGHCWWWVAVCCLRG